MTDHTGYHVTGTTDPGLFATRRAVSLWYRNVGTLGYVRVYLTASVGQKTLTYNASSGTNGNDGSGNVNIYLGTSMSTSTWTRFERNVEADYESYCGGGASWTNTDGLRFHLTSISSTSVVDVDDIRFSDSITTEVNILAPGNIGHIVRHREVDAATYVVTDRWYHYDQVGSIVNESNSSGTSAAAHNMDSWGQELSSWSTGLVGGTQGGWHFDTKEYDDDVDLVYKFQRWYLPETGTFVSASPYSPAFESRIGFADSLPVMLIDPEGEFPKVDPNNPGEPPSDYKEGRDAKRAGDAPARRCKAHPDKLDKIGQRRLPPGDLEAATRTDRDKMTKRQWRQRGRGRGFVRFPPELIGPALSGLAIGVAANLTVQSYTAQEEASGDEHEQNYLDLIWSKCDSRCKSSPGGSYSGCMKHCMPD